MYCACTYVQAMPIMTVIVGRRSDSAECNIFSTAIPSEEACQVFSVPPHPGKGSDLVTIGGPLWIKYVKGVIALLNNAGDVPPFEAVITSCVPLGGGVSSSASLEVAVGLFVENLLGRKLPREELALICQEAEHRYAGMYACACGMYVCACGMYVCVCMHACVNICREQVWYYGPVCVSHG